MKGKKGTKVGDGLANVHNKYFNMERCVHVRVCVCAHVHMCMCICCEREGCVSSDLTAGY